MRRFRRREGSADSTPAPSGELAPAESGLKPPRRLMLPRARLPFQIVWPTLIVIVALVALTVFLILANRDALPTALLLWWPLVIVVPAGLMVPLALIRRDPGSLLGGAALLGVGISLLLAAQSTAPLAGTSVGVLFITVGTAIMLRALLLRNVPLNPR